MVWLNTTKDMAGDISQGGMLIPLLLLVVLWTGVGTVPAVRSEESRGMCTRMYACVHAVREYVCVCVAYG